MAYSVEISDLAEADAADYVSLILKRSNDDQAAVDWWNGLLDALDSLERLPARCPRVPEQDRFDIPLYQLLYQSHRIVFRIDRSIVKVQRIYHSARRPLTKKSLRSRKSPRQS